MPGTSYLSGLVSNLDWATMIDQLIRVERNKIVVIEDRRTTQESQLAEWNSVKSKLSAFTATLSSLRTVEAFNKLKVSATSSSATYKASDLVSLTVGSTAAPGTHIIEMTSGCQLAQARQVSSQGFEDSEEALGLAGEFLINGRAVKVEATDSLLDIADRVNALNTGSNATRVTASVMAAGSSDYRLILTSDNTGQDAFNLQEGGSSNILLRSGGLGFYESYSNTIKNTTSNGAKSDAFTSTTVAVKNLLGLTGAPGLTTVQIGGQNVDIDLSSATETLTTIAAKIDTALGAAGSASVVSETKDGVTTYRIQVSGTTSFADSNNVLQTLGFVTGTQTSVAKSLASASTLYTAASGGTAEITEATAFNDIYGYTAGTSDTITISGTTHDGTALSTTTFNVYSGAYRTVGDLCTAIEDAYTAAGATVTATVSGGQIVVTDATAGGSLMALQLVANNEGGGNLDLGDMDVQTQGYSQQTAVGRDAIVKINGVYVQDSSNTLDEAVEGLTIDLLRIDPGTTINVSVARDYAAVQSAIKGVLDAYNDIIGYINTQFAYDEEAGSSGVLAGDATLRGVKEALQDVIASQITGLSAGWNALSLIGVESDANGILAINSTIFMEMAQKDFSAFQRVLGTQGTTTDADITYVGYGNKTQAGTYAVNITQAADQGATTGWKDLTTGIGATAEKLRITDTITGRQATLTLDPATNGSSIGNIVNALNSEFAAEYTQTIVGSVANTSGAVAITSSTTWDSIDGATLVDGDLISFEGHDRAGNTVSGSYRIGTAATDTVQGLLSAIEIAYGGQASAHIDTNGRIVLQDSEAGDSQLDITITTPAGSNLDFGTIDYTEGAGDGSVQGRGAMDITAASDGSGHLVLTHGQYGSSQGFTIEQVSDPSGANTAVLLASQANTSGGGDITAASTWDAIDGFAADTTDTITINGTGHDGTAIIETVFSIYDGGYKTVGALLTEIETAYSNAGFTVTASIENGKIKLTDATTGLSALSLTLTENTVDPGLDLGVMGSAATGLAGGDHQGVDVAGTINGEACTGSGRLLTAATPGYGETSVTQGLSVLVNLTPAQLASQGAAQGSVTLTTGAMERLWRAVDLQTDPTDGALTMRLASLQERIDDLNDTIANMEAQLERKREQLTLTFAALEQSLSHLQALSSWLAASFGTK